MANTQENRQPTNTATEQPTQPKFNSGTMAAHNAYMSQVLEIRCLSLQQVVLDLQAKLKQRDEELVKADKEKEELRSQIETLQSKTKGKAVPEAVQS